MSNITHTHRNGTHEWLGSEATGEGYKINIKPDEQPIIEVDLTKARIERLPATGPGDVERLRIVEK